MPGDFHGMELETGERKEEERKRTLAPGVADNRSGGSHCDCLVRLSRSVMFDRIRKTGRKDDDGRQEDKKPSQDGTRTGSRW